MTTRSALKLVTLNFRHRTGTSTDVIYGPSLGLTLHYGPSFESGRSGDERGPSFFALGPKVGFYVGADFVRPGETFNFQLGIHPYISPIFPVGEAPVGNGVIVGGTLDGLFRFDPSPN